MIVLDTNVVSELARQAPQTSVVRWIDAGEPFDFVLCAITVAEARVGIATMPAGRRRVNLGARMERLLTEVFERTPLPFDVEATPHYADIVATRRRAGHPIGLLDAQIAAICRLHDAALATRNVKDFAGVGIELIDPWSIN